MGIAGSRGRRRIGPSIRRPSSEGGARLTRGKLSFIFLILFVFYDLCVVAGNDWVGLLPRAFEFACYVENIGPLLNWFFFFFWRGWWGVGKKKKYCEHIDE
jgi:hypothetical protein